MRRSVAPPLPALGIVHSTSRHETADHWAWYQQTLTQLLHKLLQTRREHQAQSSETMSSPGTHHADTATDEYDHDLAFALLSHDDDALHEIKAALTRIQNGTYGICEQSGEPIPEERLRAVPWTRHTRQVEELLERTGDKDIIRIGVIHPTAPRWAP